MSKNDILHLRLRLRLRLRLHTTKFSLTQLLTRCLALIIGCLPGQEHSYSAKQLAFRRNHMNIRAIPALLLPASS
ncbi:hypothetical protein GGR52DRAFT_196373 [Hypoxylon sp. FL1284]|nr:hypothetical protein GGR52DRAFT_196373 [Hypoxylon sp. FL1284]